jgi:O-antigen/teichoic acid export membrane protein
VTARPNGGGDYTSMAAKGVAWALSATVAGRVVTLAVLAVLARLLSPDDFGLVAFALVFILYVDTVGDFGTSAALIHWSDRRVDAAQLTFLVNVASSAVWWGLTFALAGPVADFFGSPEGKDVLRALAWSFPLRALGTTHDALLQKDLRFKARVVPELALTAAKGGASLVLALMGWGVWSLVWGQLAGLALWSAVLWLVVPWRPSWSLPLDLVRPMMGYGKSIVAINMLAAVTHHADLAVVGRMLGATALGFYQIAYKIPEVAITLVVRVTSKVLFPTFSRVHQAGGGLKEAYLASLRYTSLLTLPATAGLVLLAEPIVLVCFGPEWRPSIPIFRTLAIYAGLRAIGTHVGDVLKATGRPGVLARLGVLKAILLLPALVWGGRFGAVEVAVAMTAVTGVGLLLNLGTIVVLDGVRPGQLLVALGPSLGATAVMVLGLQGLSWAMPSLGPVMTLVTGTVVGCAIYVATLATWNPTLLPQAVRAMRQVAPLTSEAA